MSLSLHSEDSMSRESVALISVQVNADVTRENIVQFNSLCGKKQTGPTSVFDRCETGSVLRHAACTQSVAQAA